MNFKKVQPGHYIAWHGSCIVHSQKQGCSWTAYDHLTGVKINAEGGLDLWTVPIFYGRHSTLAAAQQAIAEELRKEISRNGTDS
jgi:hypothetical protein